MKRIAMTAALAGLGVGSAALAQIDHTVTFENGGEGWDINGATTIIDSSSPNGNVMSHYQHQAFWIDIATTTNSTFLGDYTAKGSSVQLSIDIKANYLGNPFSDNPYPRDLVLELRDYDNVSAIRGGYNWASVYQVNPTMLSSTEPGWMTFTWTIDTTATDLPSDWGGYGAEDPVTFDPMLPADTTYADILSGVDEILFTTAVPRSFYTYSTFDLEVDNIRITTVPTPASAALLGLGGLMVTRRRRG